MRERVGGVREFARQVFEGKDERLDAAEFRGFRRDDGKERGSFK